jgi:PLP dependent protein
VLERIAAACARAGRDPGDVSLLPISKAVPADRLRLALAASLRDFGENRVQEAEAKAAAVEGACWHLVGHLQSNKAGRAVELFSTIHSVDSLALARRLDRLVVQQGRQRLAVYAQVNVDRAPAKEGFTREALQADLAELLALGGLTVLGLMTVGRFVERAEEGRPTFLRLRQLSERLRAADDRLGGGLSMGMTDDFEVAVEEGATVVRVGRAIFGERAPSRV